MADIFCSVSFLRQQFFLPLVFAGKEKGRGIRPTWDVRSQESWPMQNVGLRKVIQQVLLRKKRNQTTWIVSLVGNGHKGESRYGAMEREERTRGVAEDDWRWKSLSWILIKHRLFIEC